MELTDGPAVLMQASKLPGADRSNWCFFSKARNQRPPDVAGAAVTGLGREHALALARLIPLLGCGEEAAALAFDGLACSGSVSPVAAVTLQAIAAEERIHEDLMRGLAAALPRTDAENTLRAARRLHVSLGAGSTVMHLARIAALDAAVCTILSRLLRLNSPLLASRQVHSTLSRIRRDEARHVAVSRALVLETGGSQSLRAVGAEARLALARVLMLEGDAFETLGVDPAALERDIARLPDKLLAA